MSVSAGRSERSSSSPAAVGATHGGAAYTHNYGLKRARGAAIDLAQRGVYRLSNRLLIGNPPLGPSLRFDGARADEANAAVLQDADHQPRLAAAGVESCCVNRFYCH